MDIVDNSVPPEPEELEIAPPQWDKVYEFAEGLSYTGNIEARMKHVINWSDVSLASEVTTLHSYLAPDVSQSPIETTMKVEASVGGVTHMMPPEERFELFTEAVNTIHELANGATTPETKQNFLKRAADIAAMTVLITHPFEDGNGRTARTLAFLIRDGFNKDDPEAIDDIKLLGQNRDVTTKARGGSRLITYAPTEVAKNMNPTLYIRALAGLDIPLEANQDYRDNAHKYISILPFSN